MNSNKTAAESRPTPAAHDNSASGVGTGLSSDEVRQRQALGQVNSVHQAPSKTYGRIFADNIFTLFNTINIVLAFLVFSVGSYQNLFFMGVVISNTLIGIIQEIRAKRTIEKLSLIVEPHVSVLRDGGPQRIKVDEIVLDDIVALQAGAQICSDARVLAVEGLEVDESLLTGENHPIRKQVGDEVLSGSFVSAGSGFVHVLRVGMDNYAMKLAHEARRSKRIRSQLVIILNRIIRVLSYIIVPVGLLLLFSQMRGGYSYSEAIVSTVGGIIGMIPEGLILLSSVAFAVGVINLSKHKTLVQALPCIETLARVNVLCLDKTGTITDGTMEVEEVIICPRETPSPVDASPHADDGETDDARAALANQALRALVAVSTDTNATQMALKRFFGGAAPGSHGAWDLRSIVPFSARRRYSGACFAGSSWIIGSPEDLYPQAAEKVAGYASQGFRVLALVRVWGDLPEALSREILPEGRELYALVVLADTIRPEAAETFRFFADQGVEIKVISGDNPLTVAATAQKAGLAGAHRYIDVSTLKEADDWQDIAETRTIFGRVDPYSKKKLIESLRSRGHVVGMTGDGVNDVLALKEADCSIAMASGSDAARAVSQLVLLESNFSALPAVVHEGRRVVNNIERVAVLYLVKTVYSALLCVAFILLQQRYPLFPVNLTLIGMACIGIPSFFLALAANKNRVEGDFLKKTLNKAGPCGLLVAVNVLAVQLVSMMMSWDTVMTGTLAVFLTGAIGLMVLANVCSPLQGKRLLLLICMIVLFAVGFSGLGLLDGAEVEGGLVSWWHMSPMVLLCLFLAAALNWFVVRFIFRWAKRREQEM